MENEVAILSKQYVCEHGIDFDEKLWFTSYSDEVLDNPEDEGGKPFTGLAYELHDNGNLKSQCYMVRGQVRGTEKVWYESGEKI